MICCLSGCHPESNGDDVIDDFSSRAFSCGIICDAEHEDTLLTIVCPESFRRGLQSLLLPGEAFGHQSHATCRHYHTRA